MCHKNPANQPVNENTIIKSLLKEILLLMKWFDTYMRLIVLKCRSPWDVMTYVEYCRIAIIEFEL